MIALLQEDKDMAQILVRKLNEDVVERLKERAKKQGRSLESEVRIILEDAAKVDRETAVRMVNEIRAKLGDRRFSDSVDIIREFREQR
jgi:plasmid stability protein